MLSSEPREGASVLMHRARDGPQLTLPQEEVEEAEGSGHLGNRSADIKPAAPCLGLSSPPQGEKHISSASQPPGYGCHSSPRGLIRVTGCLPSGLCRSQGCHSLPP